MTIKNRMKASDVFRETNYVFVKKEKDFDKAFPGIESVRMEIKEIGSHEYRKRGISVYTKETFREYHDCTNTLCYNGGFSMGQIVREMIQDNKTHWEGNKICQGYEGSPKGRRKYRKCVNMWSIKVDIEYKKENKNKK